MRTFLDSQKVEATVPTNESEMTSSITIGALSEGGCEELLVTLKKNLHVIKTLHLKQELFQSQGFHSPTRRNFQDLVKCIKQMDHLETLSLHGKLSIDNLHDVIVLGRAIASHPTLRQFELQEFMIYATDTLSDIPVLEPLLESVLTIPSLETFRLKCWDCFKRWQGCCFRRESLKRLVQSPHLVNLTLSGVGLGDGDFVALSEEIGNNKASRLQELILNDNGNTDKGAAALAMLLQRNKTITVLETRNTHRIGQAVCDSFLESLERNCTLQRLQLNLPFSYLEEAKFYVSLNKAGRRFLVNPDVSPEQVLNVLSSAQGDVGILLRLLQEHPQICQWKS